MQPIDIQRVTDTPPWDGLQDTKFGRVLVFPTKTAMRIADLGRDAAPQIKKRLTKEEINIIAGTIAFAVVIFGMIVGLRFG